MLKRSTILKIDSKTLSNQKISENDGKDNQKSKEKTKQNEEFLEESSKKLKMSSILKGPED